MVSTYIKIKSCGTRFCIDVNIEKGKTSIYVMANGQLVARGERIELIDQMVRELQELRQEIEKNMKKFIEG